VRRWDCACASLCFTLQRKRTLDGQYRSDGADNGNYHLANCAGTMMVEVTVGRGLTGLPSRSTVRKVVVLVVPRGVMVVQLVDGLCDGGVASAAISTSSASVGICG
jgi:hypothetical protein